MARYLATVRKELEIRFEFTDDDIEDGDDPQIAAEELALSEPSHFWDEIWFEADVKEIV